MYWFKGCGAVGLEAQTGAVCKFFEPQQGQKRYYGKEPQCPLAYAAKSYARRHCGK